MGPAHSEPRRYAAFISYAHADEVMAARLHRALETYPVPRHLRSQGKTTKPVFRDVAELSAAHSLTEKIRAAVKGSRVLIVLCSPAAKASHWVNEEIRLFREIHGEAAILPAIIDGTPETAFPKALTEGGREPLAAALGADKAGFKLGVTQLAAGMLGTGLDDLIQRGAKRRNRIMATGLAASLLFSGAMGFTAYQAVDARNAAQTARGEAEGLVEYMIKDLKIKLEPVGRLDLLEGIGDKAVEYYDKQDIKNLPDKSLNRQAAARQVLAQVHLDAGRMEAAQKEIEASAALTREVLARNPDDTDAIFAHAQSEYWVGLYFFNQNKYSQAEPYWQEYDRLSQKLYNIDPKNYDWIMEAAYSANNLGAIFVQKNIYQEESMHLNRALEFFDLAKNEKPDNDLIDYEIANTLGFISDALERYGPAERALEARQKQVKFFRSYKNLYKNLDVKYRYSEAKFLKIRLSTLIAGFENLDLDLDFEAVISELEALTAHDLNNLLWQRTLLRAYIDYYFYTQDKNTQNELRIKIANLKSRLLPVLEDKNILEIFYAELIEGQTTSESYYRWISIFPEDSEEEAIISSELMRLDTDLFKQEDIKKYANIVVSHYQDDYNSIEPKAIQRLTEAYMILGDCETALRRIENLKKRGYKTPNLSLCS